MMKILILANSDIGLFKFRKELIETFLKEQDDIYISAPQGEYYHQISRMGCRYIITPLERRGMNPFKDMQLMFRYYKKIRELKPDYVLTYTIKPNIYGGMACRICRVPYAMNITGLGTAFQKQGLMRKLVVQMYKIASKRARTVFFENKGNYSVFLQEGLVTTEQACVLNGAGVNLDYYKYLPYSENEGIHFLFVGRIMKEKGVEELFEVVKKIKSMYGDKVVFDIVGFFEEAYKDIIEQLDQKGIIHFWGYQQDIRPFYQKTSCLVLPSYHEGMSNVLLEAAASGRALITSNIHGCMEAVEDGKNGYLCEVKNSQSLFSAINKFINLNIDERRNMGWNSRKRMELLFDKKKIVSKTIKKIKQR